MAFEKKNHKVSWCKRDSMLTYKQKRGKLSLLMTEEQKKTAQIQELSYDFGCRMARLYQYLTEDADYKEFIFSKQLVRCGTSVGANVREPMEQRVQSLKLAC